MVNEEILGGLKSALSRKESLQQAMISFYNAGYKKEEIEEAARALQTEKSQQSIQQTQQPIQKPTQQVMPAQSTKKLKSQQIQKPKPKPIQKPKPIKPVQKVSNYEQKPKQYSTLTFVFKGKMITIILSLILFILLGIIASLFFFGKEIVDFFTSLFS